MKTVKRYWDTCKSGTDQLLIPSFCVAEPFDTIVRRGKSREDLNDKLNTELSQIGRSKPYQEKVDAFRAVTTLLVQPNEEERDNLYQTLEEILSIATTIDMNKEILSFAAAYRKTHGFRLQDSMVYSSVVFHAKRAGTEQKCFITRDDHFFKNSDIIEEMSALQCQIFREFDAGFGYISHQ